MEEDWRDQEKSQGYHVSETEKYGEHAEENGEAETEGRRTNDDLVTKPSF